MRNDSGSSGGPGRVIVLPSRAAAEMDKSRPSRWRPFMQSTPRPPSVARRRVPWLSAPTRRAGASILDERGEVAHRLKHGTIEAMHLPNRNKGEIVAMSVWLSDSHSEWERSLVRGRLFVTNQRLVFHPDWRYRALRRSGWEIELDQVDRSEG